MTSCISDHKDAVVLTLHSTTVHSLAVKHTVSMCGIKVSGSTILELDWSAWVLRTSPDIQTLVLSIDGDNFVDTRA